MTKKDQDNDCAPVSFAYTTERTHFSSKPARTDRRAAVINPQQPQNATRYKNKRASLRNERKTLDPVERRDRRASALPGHELDRAYRDACKQPRNFSLSLFPSVFTRRALLACLTDHRCVRHFFSP